MDEFKIKVSIITVCRNSAKTIEKTIEHVLNQTYKNLEYIIIDGMSTDNTLEIVKKYEPQFNGRMKVVSEPDKGIYDAMNKGIKLATGELIGISNSDDWLEYDAVEKIVDRYDKCEPYQILYGFVANWSSEVRTRITFVNHENMRRVCIPHPTCFITRAFYNDFEMYSEKYKLIADYELLLKAFLSGKVKFVPVYELIANFTEGGASDSWLCKKDEFYCMKSTVL